MQGKEISTPLVIGIIVLVLAGVGGIWWYMSGRTEAAQATSSQAPPSWIDPATGRPRAGVTTTSGGGSPAGAVPGGPGTAVPASAAK